MAVIMLPLDCCKRIREMLASQKQKLQHLSLMLLIQFSVAGIGVITQIKIANVLGIDNFGLIAYGIAIATYGATFIRFGLDKTLVRDLIHYPDRYTATVKASLVLRYAILALLVIAILVWKILAPSTSDLTWGVVLISIANMCLCVDLQGVFDSWHKMPQHGLYFMFQKGLYFSLIWSILIVDPGLLSVFAIGVAVLLSVSFYLVLQYSWVIKRLPVDTAKEKVAPLILNILRSNVYVWFASLGMLSFGPLNQLLLKYFHGPVALGGYAVAWMMVTIVSILLTQIARIGNPATARITDGTATKDQVKFFLKKYTALMVAVTAPVAAPAIIAPDLLLKTFFRPEYLLAAPVLRIMGIYVFVISVDLITTQYVLSARMEKSYLFSVLFSGLASLLLCLILIPSAGAVGAAWALLISHGMLISLRWAQIGYSLRGK